MADRPNEDEPARASLWFGTAVLIATAAIWPEHRRMWLLISIIFLAIGLITLPKHPRHYQDFDNPDL